MKKIFMSMLALVALASCSSEEVLNEPVDNGQRVPITMRAAVVNVGTKAAIESDNDGKTTEDITEVVFYKLEDDETPATLNWASSVKCSATIKATDGTIEFTPTIYYPSNPNKYAHLIGFHPGTIAGTFTNNSLSINGFNGTQDIIYATKVSGNKSTTSAPTAEFNHKLSQFKFKLSSSNFDTTDPLNNVTKISVKGTHQPQSIDLETGKITYGTTEFTAELDLSAENSNTGVVVGNELDKSLLIQPYDSANPYTLTMTITLKSGVTIDVAGLTVADQPAEGSSYLIDLTFSQKEISGNATITHWTVKTGAAGTVQ